MDKRTHVSKRERRMESVPTKYLNALRPVSEIIGMGLAGKNPALSSTLSPERGRSHLSKISRKKKDGTSSYLAEHEDLDASMKPCIATNFSTF